MAKCHMNTHKKPPCLTTERHLSTKSLCDTIQTTCLVILGRLQLPTRTLEVCCSMQLSYRTIKTGSAEPENSKNNNTKIQNLIAYIDYFEL